MSILSDQKKKKVETDISNQVAAQLANAGTINQQLASDATRDGMELFLKVAERTKNVGFDQRKGNLFEYIEAAKFNRNAARAGVSTRAVVTDAVGRPHAAADIELIDKRGNIIREVQAKFTDTHSASTGKNTSAATSVFDHAGGQKGHWGKYRGMQRLIRKDDAYAVNPETGEPVSLLGKAQDLARSRAQVENGLHADEYADVARNLTDELTDETTGVKSGGTTLEEVRRANDDPQRYVRNVKLQQYTSEIASSAAVGAAGGAIMGGIMSSISNALDIYHNKKELSEAIGEIGATVVKGGVRGGATGGISAILRITGRECSIPVISDSIASTVIAGSIIDVGVAVYSYGRGELSASELQESISDTAIKATTTIFMSKAAVLALGGCGAFVPMAVYSVSSYMVACTREIIKQAKLNAAEYQRLADLLNAETAIIAQQRALLEEQLAQYTSTRQSAMKELMSNFDLAMQGDGNYDLAITSIIAFSNEMGLSLQHATRAEFDTEMVRRDSFVLP